MARTKEVAMKSIGGKAPRKQLTEYSLKTLTISDHTGNNILLTGVTSRSGLNAFPFQIYLLSTAANLATDKKFPEQLHCYIESNDACIRFNENCRWRLEIYTLPQGSILDCINHHEKEKHYRKSVGTGPIMLNRKELFIVDNMYWDSTGLLSVDYTAQFMGRDGSERDFENYINYRAGWDHEEELALPDLRQDLVVRRHKDPNELAEVLNFIWYDEGHEWVLGALTERNVALGWEADPRLLQLNTLPDTPVAGNITRGYIRGEKRPLDDCEDEHEDEDEYEDEIFDSLEAEALVTYGESCDPDTAMPKSILHILKEALPSVQESLPSLDLTDIKVEEGVDAVGIKCIDCKHVVHTSSHSHFSYNLYILGSKSYSPAALFALLDCKFLTCVPWILHVYNVGGLPAALSHCRSEIASRSSSSRLPTSYAKLPEQPHPYVLLYLDEHAGLETGPRVVTMTDNSSTTTGSIFEVTYPGGWKDAAQILFTYVVLSSETSDMMAPDKVCTPPSIQASVSLEIGHPLPGPCRSSGETHLTLTLALDTTVTHTVSVHTQNTILDPNVYFWDTFLRIIDTETNAEVPVPPLPSFKAERPWSIEQLQSLSFPFSATSHIRNQILTLRPGEKAVRTVIFKDSRLYEWFQDALVEGRSYKIEVRPGLVAEKWIWGDMESNTGALGKRPISILGSETAATFIFTGKVAVDPYSSLHCHIDDSGW